MFGIGLDETYEVTLYEDLRLDVRPGDVVFVTGPSGSGKSVLLTRLHEAVCRAPIAARAVSLAGIDLSEDRPVIDLLGGPLDRRLRLLSTAGLADAFLLLRTPAELSDGQRYRLRLARAIERLLFDDEEETRLASGAAKQDSPKRVLVADEFCSTLDRLCAGPLPTACGGWPTPRVSPSWPPAPTTTSSKTWPPTCWSSSTRPTALRSATPTPPAR